MDESRTSDYQKSYELAKLTTPEAYRLFLQEFDGPYFGIEPDGEEEDQTPRIKKWISDNKRMLHDRICNERLHFLFAPPENTREKALIITAIADAIAGLALGVSPITAATLLVTYGLKKLCTEEE